MTGHGCHHKWVHRYVATSQPCLVEQERAAKPADSQGSSTLCAEQREQHARWTLVLLRTLILRGWHRVRLSATNAGRWYLRPTPKTKIAKLVISSHAVSCSDTTASHGVPTSANTALVKHVIVHQRGRVDHFCYLCEASMFVRHLPALHCGHCEADC